MQLMKNLLAVMAIIVLLISCSRSVTVQQAANNHYNKCRPIR